MSIRIFKSALIRQQLNQKELDDLAADFLSYKKGWRVARYLWS